MPQYLELSLEEVVVAVYCALDDALTHAGRAPCNGKLIPRPGPPPEVDDREVLCLAVLQELLGFESDHRFHCWLHRQPLMQALFPRQLSRQNFADRRALLKPLMDLLNESYCDLAEGRPPFFSSIPIPWKSVRPSALARKDGSTASRDAAIAPCIAATSSVCAST